MNIQADGTIYVVSTGAEEWQEPDYSSQGIVYYPSSAFTTRAAADKWAAKIVKNGGQSRVDAVGLED